jgi:hypothetical protein
LISEGYIYNKETRKFRKNEWRCCIKRCPGSGSVICDQFYRLNEHDHQTQEEKITKNKTMQSIKATALEEKRSNVSIVTNVTKNFQEKTINTLPNFKSILDACTRVRYKKLPFFKPSLEDIPDILSFDLQKKKFIQYDSGVVDINRFVIMFSESNINLMHKIETVLIDGTFWSTPSPFYQLLTINCQCFGRYFLRDRTVSLIFNKN